MDILIFSHPRKADHGTNKENSLLCRPCFLRTGYQAVMWSMLECMPMRQNFEKANIFSQNVRDIAAKEKIMLMKIFFNL